MKDKHLLVINPGSTSTKVALFNGLDCYRQENLVHSADELSNFPRIIDQFEYRLRAIEAFLDTRGSIALDAVVGRGGLLYPLSGGTYAVSDLMQQHLREGVQGDHASNLGGLLARRLADKRGIPSFIVDPVAVDEFEDVARISGHPLIHRRSLFHALNIKAVARRVANDLNKSIADMNMIVAHLGGGISIAPMRKGRVVDVNNANEMGPFSPERVGGLPCGDVVALCFSGDYTAQELKKEFTGKGGMVAYLGTNDARQAYGLAEQGNEKAELIMQAMAYQVAKEVGAMSSVLKGDVDAVVLTGGLAHSARLTSEIASYISFLAPVIIHPGEDEMLALAEGALRVLMGEECALDYMGKQN